MSEKQDLRPYFDAIWDEWLGGRDLGDEIAKHRVERARFHQLIEDCIERVGRQPARLLEIGSGTAIDSYILAEDSTAHITGIDISLPSLHVAALCGKFFPRPIDLAAADAERLPVSYTHLTLPTICSV